MAQVKLSFTIIFCGESKKIKKICKKVMRELIVDTRKYRYICADCCDHSEIRRLPLEYLDTTAALDGWETVQIIDKK